MVNNFKDLDGKWALILGASSGFGGATSLALARAGMHICGVHLDRKATMENVDRVVNGIQEAGREALFFNVNASDEAKRKEVLDALAPKLGKNGQVSVLLHSLAFGTLKPFIGPEGEMINKTQMEMTLDVMAHSLVYWVQDLLMRNLMGKGSRIYAMTSAGGERVWPTYGAVSAAKAALESHIRQLALELAPKGITANAVRAGVTDTPALRKIPGNEKMIEIATAKNPGKRLTTPEDVAQAIVAFSLPLTDWLNGNVLGVDGGENIVD
ncbi:MAG TPA: SDR family oxidoreductase [Bdellovibrionota bacterium]|nr:SDR family oxidoreductase [Bdellovibrionota bacterium]